MSNDTTVVVWAWHVHHDQLAEPLHEPIEARQAYIRAEKPQAEHAVRLARLRLMQGPVPARIQDAAAARARALAICVQAWLTPTSAEATYASAKAAYAEAWTVLAQVVATDPDLAALHAQECPDCPWDGRTLFPAAREGRRGDGRT